MALSGRRRSSPAPDGPLPPAIVEETPPSRPSSHRFRVPPSRPEAAPGGPPAAVGRFVRGGAAALSRQPDAGRFGVALLLSLLGLLLAGGGVVADLAFHRGVETGGSAPWVRHPSGRGLATNVDLTRFAPGDIEAVVAALQQSGFRYVRQSVSWAEIEPTPGAYVWEPYDAIVEALTRHLLEPVVVLHDSPGWARAPAQQDSPDAPPVDAAAYARFAEAVAARYGPVDGRSRVSFLQLWDLPNRPDRWGGMPADAAGYVELLSLGFNAVRSANPNATVVLAELDPGAPHGAPNGDLTFLRDLYRNGGRPYFNVAAAAVDGGARSPFDRRVDPGTASLSRAVLFREAMVEAGDDAKPVWATHYGWRTGADAGSVTAADQAAYAVAGLERARTEWAWMGPMFAWGLVPGPGLGGAVEPGRELLRANGVATPLYDALATFAADGGTAAAPTGFLPVDAPQFDLEGNWDVQHLGSTIYRTTREDDARTTVRFVGTGAVALLRFGPDAGQVKASVDGEPIALALDAIQAQDVPISLADGLEDGPHTLTLELDGPGQLTIGGLEVVRDTPLRWPVALVVVGGVGLLFLGLREAVYTIAHRTGRLQRRRGIEFWPELPPLQDWRPARRA